MLNIIRFFVYGFYVYMYCIYKLFGLLVLEKWENNKCLFYKIIFGVEVISYCCNFYNVI